MTRVQARLLGALLAAVLTLGAAGAATAATVYKDTPGAALHDCGAGHDPLVGHYSVKVLQTALRDLRTNSLQYTTCADALQNAIDSELTGHRKKPVKHHRGGTTPRRGGKTPGTTTTHTQTQSQSTTALPDLVRKRVDQVKQQGRKPVRLNGQTVTPGAVTVRTASFLSGVPTPLLIVLAALLATVVAVSARAIHHVVRTRRPH
jgi:hypothetical protein